MPNIHRLAVSIGPLSPRRLMPELHFRVSQNGFTSGWHWEVTAADQTIVGRGPFRLFLDELVQTKSRPGVGSTGAALTLDHASESAGDEAARTG